MTEPTEQIIDGQRLAHIVIYELYRKLEQAQDNIIRLEARVVRFGSHAMPLHQSSTETLAKAEEYVRREIEYWTEKVGEYTATLVPLEALMKQANDADMAAMADFLRDRWKKGEGKK